MIQLDLLLTNLLSNTIPHTAATNLLFMFLSAVGSFALIWILLGIVLILFEEKRHREFIIFFLGGLLLTTILVNNVIKPLVHRERPITTVVQQPTDYSFPSGHAATSFFAAAVLTYYHRKKRALFLTLAILISFSRMYLGVHYFGDVLAGAIIGLFIAYAINNLKVHVSSSRPPARFAARRAGEAGRRGFRHS